MVCHNHNCPEFTDGPGCAHDDTQYHVPPGQGNRNAQKCGKFSRTKRSGCIFKLDGNTFETSFYRIDIKGEPHKKQNTDNTGPGAHNLYPDVGQKSANGMISSGQAEDGNADDRMGDHDRQIDDPLYYFFPDNLLSGQKIGKWGSH